MKRPSIIPRFAITKVSGSTADIDNLQVAATIFAFDVPLNEQNPYDTQAGDGIKGVRVVWHFEQRDPAGNSPKAIAKHFLDQNWQRANPDHPVAVCKRAFDEHARLKTYLREGRGLSIHSGPCAPVTNTRKAAVLIALGHPLKGWRRNDQVTTWCFDVAASPDSALYDSEDLYQRLPDAAISYAKGAILGHESMIAASKKIQTARVTHRGRTAIIGKDLPKDQLDKIEKQLFRK